MRAQIRAGLTADPAESLRASTPTPTPPFLPPPPLPDTCTPPPRGQFTSQRDGQMSSGAVRSAGWPASPWRPLGSCFSSSAEALRTELHLLCGSATSQSKDGGTLSTCCQQTEIKTQIKTETLKKKEKEKRKPCTGSVHGQRARAAFPARFASRRNLAPPWPASPD